MRVAKLTLGRVEERAPDGGAVQTAIFLCLLSDLCFAVVVSSRRRINKTVFQPLLEFLAKVPAISGAVGSGVGDDGRWWVKFAINVDHPLAWNVVQELGHVLNYVSLNERLPTVFMPVSPPPYMNGGPREFLSWVIESKDDDFSPKDCAQWLKGRLPRPVEDASQWETEDED